MPQYSPRVKKESYQKIEDTKELIDAKELTAFLADKPSINALNFSLLFLGLP